MEKFGTIELTSEELFSIDGGRTLNYYLGLFIGAAVGTAVALIKGFQDGVDGHHE